MKLSKNNIEHIAKLARLELTNEEYEKYGSQLSAVLSYIDQLNEINTDDIEPTAQVTGLLNALREDQIEDWDNEERIAAINQAPELENGQYKVKRVLE